MANKVPAQIIDIQLNDASYRNTNTHIEGLTFVNFFFGNNGTGKSTIAKAIKSDGSGITYGSGRTHGEFLHLVFDQDFIDNHFHSYNNMKGVFTLGAVGKETQDKIDAKEEEKKAARKAADEAKKEQDKRKSAVDFLIDSMAKECWKITADLRTDFAKALPKKPSMKSFLDTVLGAIPKDISLDELRRFYDSAYSEGADRYDEFQPADDCHVLEKVNGLDVLGISVVNTANTDFAAFLKRIDATQWVREGHEAYAEVANGVCPYCYRELQEGFETLLAQSFDTQYQENMKKIEDLLVLYKQAANALFIPLSKTPQNVYPKLDKKKYDSKLAAIKNAIQLNIEVISNKKDIPEQIFELQDVATLLTELNDIVAEFNKLIRENNAIVAAQPKKQAECTADVYSYIAFILKDKLVAYTKSKADLSAVPLVNVVRRILEYYFLQLCGHEGSSLRQQILIDGRHKFVDENGNEDVEKYHIAQTMLAYINANSMATNDDIYFVDDSLDVTECRNTFKLLFEIMGQDQHFNKMMGY